MFWRKKKQTDQNDPDGQIIRHTAERPYESVHEAGRYAEAIEAHVGRHIGQIDMVFHEVVSDKVHLDLLWISPEPNDRDFHTFVTSGMSARPMNMPGDFPDPEDWDHAELVLNLPADWPVGQKEFENEENFWPVRWLKTVARLPHEYDTFILPSHTIPTDEPAEPVSRNAAFTGFAVWPGVIAGDDFAELEAPDGQAIHFYTLIPLYTDEMDFKLKNGFDALYDRMTNADLSYVVDRARASVI